MIETSEGPASVLTVGTGSALCSVWLFSTDRSQKNFSFRAKQTWEIDIV